MSPIPVGSWTILGVSNASTSNPVKSDASWTDIPEMSIQVTSDVPLIGVLFEGTFLLAPATLGSIVQGQIRLAVNGTPIATSVRTLRMKAPSSLLAITPGDGHELIPLSATLEVTPGATLTISAQWSVTSQSLTAVGLERELKIRRIE